MRTLLASHDILNGAERGRAVKQYNKLIRDTVPAIMPAGGRRMVTRAVVGEELRAALRAKLEQEVAEYDAAANDDLATIELADLLEVVMALAARRGAARRGAASTKPRSSGSGPPRPSNAAHSMAGTSCSRPSRRRTGRAASGGRRSRRRATLGGRS